MQVLGQVDTIISYLYVDIVPEHIKRDGMQSEIKNKHNKKIVNIIIQNNCMLGHNINDPIQLHLSFHVLRHRSSS